MARSDARLCGRSRLSARYVDVLWVAIAALTVLVARGAFTSGESFGPCWSARRCLRRSRTDAVGSLVDVRRPPRKADSPSFVGKFVQCQQHRATCTRHVRQSVLLSGERRALSGSTFAVVDVLARLDPGRFCAAGSAKCRAPASSRVRLCIGISSRRRSSISRTGIPGRTDSDSVHSTTSRCGFHCGPSLRRWQPWKAVPGSQGMPESEAWSSPAPHGPRRPRNRYGGDQPVGSSQPSHHTTRDSSEPGEVVVAESGICHDLSLPHGASRRISYPGALQLMKGRKVGVVQRVDLDHDRFGRATVQYA